MNRNRYLLFAALLLALNIAAISRAQADWQPRVTTQGLPLGTAFSYQGYLSRSGQPVDGPTDFRFTLYDAVTSGAQVGQAIEKKNLPVSAGLFVTELDFGPVFNGGQRFLEIAVRPGGSTGSYTALSPRQAVGATPYALGLHLPYAAAAFNPNSATIFVGNTSSSAHGISPNISRSSGAAIALESDSGDGVTAVSHASRGHSAVDGQNDGTGDGVSGEATDGAGVSGTSANGEGVVAQSTRSAGVRATSQDGEGVVAQSTTRAGVFATSQDGEGVVAQSVHRAGVSATSQDAIGVYGGSTSSVGVYGDSDNEAGVVGISAKSDGVRGASISGIGVYGYSPNGSAGYFDGGVQVSGNLTVTGTIINAAAGAATIDHPLDPANKYLSHAFVGSPDMLNIYSGNVATDAQGDAEVVLPEYFEALNRDFRYQLTVIGQFAQAIVAREIEGNRFVIRTDKPYVKVSWQVAGIRRDPYAEAHRISVEAAKPLAERGTYLHPSAYGQPETLGLGYQRNKERMPPPVQERRWRRGMLEDAP
jgi:hypothetical protein